MGCAGCRFREKIIRPLPAKGAFLFKLTLVLKYFKYLNNNIIYI